MKMDFSDLNYINNKFKADYKKIFDENLSKNQLILGDEVENFENDFAKYNKSKFCKTLNSGYDALYLSLLYIKKHTTRKKVIVQAHSFYASFSSIIAAGFEVLALDVSKENFNINFEQLKEYISDEVAAVINVRLYGICGDSLEIQRLCKTYGAYFIEDCAQSHGIIKDSEKLFKYKNYMQAYSFYPTKNLGALGDGGAVLTSSSKINYFIKSYRDYGKKTKFKHMYLGINSRLDTLQASLLKFKLKQLDKINEVRRSNAIYYSKKINNDNLLIKLPYSNLNKISFSPHVFPLFVKNKKSLIKKFEKFKINYGFHYPYSIRDFRHLFKDKLIIKDCRLSIKMAKNVISIPFGMHLKKEQQDLIIDIINQ